MERRRRAATRHALVLGLVAVSVFLGFIAWTLVHRG